MVSVRNMPHTATNTKRRSSANLSSILWRGLVRRGMRSADMWRLAGWLSSLPLSSINRFDFLFEHAASLFLLSFNGFSLASSAFDPLSLNCMLVLPQVLGYNTGSSVRAFFSRQIMAIHGQTLMGWGELKGSLGKMRVSR